MPVVQKGLFVRSISLAPANYFFLCLVAQLFLTESCLAPVCAQSGSLPLVHGGDETSVKEVSVSVDSKKVTVLAPFPKVEAGTGPNRNSEVFGEEADLRAYTAGVEKNIGRVWFPPKCVDRRWGKATFAIHKDGTVSGLKLSVGTGIRKGDLSIVRAIEGAAPFKPYSCNRSESIDFEAFFLTPSKIFAFPVVKAAESEKCVAENCHDRSLRSSDNSQFSDIKSVIRGPEISPVPKCHWTISRDADLGGGDCRNEFKDVSGKTAILSELFSRKYDQYMGNVKQKIRDNWLPPIGEESRPVVVRFLLHSGGGISGAEIIQSGGSAAGDLAALRAIVSCPSFGARPGFSNSMPDTLGELLCIELTFY